MSLLDIAQSIKKEGFDPRKDSANGPAPIPAGEYQAILKSVQFNVAESGWESLQYRFEIRGGDYDGRNLFHSVPWTLGTGKISAGQYNVQSSFSKKPWPLQTTHP